MFFAGTLVPDQNATDKSGKLLRCTATCRRTTLFSPYRRHDRATEKRHFHVRGVVMRTVLFGLILLTVGKVWFQDHTYRAAMSDAVVDAYRDRAIEVCRKIALKHAVGAREDGVSAWGSASNVEAIVGNPDIQVAIWDTQNPLWTQRFRDPQLVLTSTNSSARCAYDVRQGGATLSLAAR